MLAVDVDELVANLAQLCGGGHAGIDPSAAFALGVNGALEQQLVLGIKSVVFQPSAQSGGEGKFSAYFGASGPFTNHSGVGPSAQYQLQGVHQDGLASASLTTQDTEARGQIQLQMPHDDKVAQDDA